MALSGASTIECRPGSGSDTNGGGCTNAAGTNLTLQNSAAYAVTDLVTDGTTTVTSASANWGTDVVGNFMYIAGGTGSITGNWYQINSRTSSSAVVVDRSTGLTTGTGATSNVGGALATIGGMGKLLASAGVAGMNFYIKSGTDTLTSSTSNVSGGRFATVFNDVSVIGYNSTRGDLTDQIGSANRPVIDCGAITSFTAISGSSAARATIANIKVDGKSNSSVIGFDGYQNYCRYINCTAVNCTTGFNNIVALFSSATSCGTGFNSMMFGFGTFSKSCTTAGITLQNISTIIGHLSINDAIGINGNSAAPTMILHSTLHEASGDGITALGTSCAIINTVFTGNTGDAIDFGSTGSGPLNYLGVHNAFRGNGTIYEATPYSGLITGAITLTADPYVTEASDDMRPNNTAGGGALLRGAGIAMLGQTNNNDVGAIQHTDPSGGGTNIIKILKRII